MVSGVIARLRSLWRGVRGRDAFESEMNEEFRAHIELRADDLERTGLSRERAVRQARLEFGSAESYKEQGAAQRGLKRYDELRVSWLDFKLGFRMLSKYPGLTIVGGLAIAFAVTAGAGAFEFINQMMYPKLPLEDGDRVIAIRVWDPATSRVEQRTLHDLARWRSSVRSIEEWGAFRTLERNLITADAIQGGPLTIAEMSASGFRIANVQPRLGRTLLDSDERAGAPPVVVIGHDLWTSRFAADPGVIGQTVRLGKIAATVVGVMPAHFEFPVSHDAWVPFQLDPLDYGSDPGPVLTKVFGRLAPGVSIEQANAELTTVGLDPAVRSVRATATRAALRAVVLPYPTSFFLLNTSEAAGLLSVNVFIGMLMALVCSNVALLMFARAATRDGEITVRTALGASRTRIITQLFAEALVLGAVGAVVGLIAAGKSLEIALATMEAGDANRLPFWFSSHLAPMTYAYAALLTIGGAAIAGILPAVKVTRGLESRLRQAAAGGGGLRFGGIWTAVIVMQVAVTVAFPVTTFFVRRDGVQVESLNVGFNDAEYLSAKLNVDRPGFGEADSTNAAYTAYTAGTRESAQELARRLALEPGVTGVTFTSTLPRTYHEARVIELDAGEVAPYDSSRGIRVSQALVATNYFDVLGAPLLAGREFNSGDLAGGGRVAIVNQWFVREVLGGRNPLGRRLRLAAKTDDGVTTEAGPWLEIVGVAKDLGMTDGGDPARPGAGFYQPAIAGVQLPTHVVVHLRGEPGAFTPRIRAIAMAVDPSLRLADIVPLARVQEANLAMISLWVRILLFVSGIALLLSLAGIYAVMSFTVSRRTREIGIRLALGSDRRRIMSTIFAQPLRQVGLGILGGAVLTTGLVKLMGLEMNALAFGIVTGYALLMLAVCLLAAVVPTRRALAIQPTEALRAE